uniref:NADH-ubiquinone oxidoreductase chain 3 n=1 Tax=Stylochyrus rarior TaxID=679428 RepID=D0UY36_STYRA|nr:NADH dehydrogenase subunit 3 [Stylochyrus rarior]ACY35980.1 NADH dehydrogenase subunit 3 [Stylochyrus rarior]
MQLFYSIWFLVLVILMLGLYLSKKTFLDKEKTSSFECGFDPFFMTRTPFSLRFFKISIIFIIFDIEIILMLPLPLMPPLLNTSNTITVMVLLFIIMMGLLYEWLQGSLDWIK